LKLALGTVQFGLSYGVANQSGQVTQDEGRAMLQLAAINQIDTLDTAIAYGESEQRLGEIGVSGWNIVSKLPAIPDDCNDVAKWIADAVEGSRQRLNVDSLYGMLLHRPQQLMDKAGNDIYRALEQLKQDGVVQKIGVSIYEPSELNALCKYFQFDLVQAPFNILDRRLIDTGWMTRLSEQGTELHVRSVFLQGVLLMPEGKIPSKFNRWDSLWAKWYSWLEDVKLTPLQACLCHALSFPEIDKVIVGVDNQNQLIEIIQAVKGVIPDVPDELKSDDLDLINPARWTALS